MPLQKSKNKLLIINNNKVVVDEPSIVAMDRTTGKVIAIGRKAQQMHGKTHENIKTIIAKNLIFIYVAK